MEPKDVTRIEFGVDTYLADQDPVWVLSKLGIHVIRGDKEIPITYRLRQSAKLRWNDAIPDVRINWLAERGFRNGAAIPQEEDGEIIKYSAETLADTSWIELPEQLRQVLTPFLENLPIWSFP